jgi:hypothetical protein
MQIGKTATRTGALGKNEVDSPSYNLYHYSKKKKKSDDWKKPIINISFA